ncbi:hypothetical protein [Clostridium sp. E02]|uniref:hypothetical protein n=1 Tax=Clostridium sp. E02 TaxID=2487134 RepID=UPI000F5310ED|nr:hypothetical protein [Clostridium sp. E02]
MKITVYHPQTKEDKKELGIKAAVIYNQTLFQFLKELSCPADQKQALINAIHSNHQSQQSN